MPVTVNWKLVLALRRLALPTVTVIAAVPTWVETGVTVTVRLAPEPPNVMFACGTKVGLEEKPDKVRLLTGVTGSPTVNASGPAAEPWLMD